MIVSQTTLRKDPFRCPFYRTLSASVDSRVERGRDQRSPMADPSASISESFPGNCKIEVERTARLRDTLLLTTSGKREDSPEWCKGAEHRFANPWKIDDAPGSTYSVRHWGKDYFGINAKGHVTVHPNQRSRAVDRLEGTGRSAPGTRAFNCRSCFASRDILRHRVGEIHDAFRTAIREYDYQGKLLLHLSARSRSINSGTS